MGNICGSICNDKRASEDDKTTEKVVLDEDSEDNKTTKKVMLIEDDPSLDCVDAMVKLFPAFKAKFNESDEEK